MTTAHAIFVAACITGILVLGLMEIFREARR
jgi:hypothetical protein